MNVSTRIVSLALAAMLGLFTLAPAAARADGTASTRNIIFGAAAIGGTLLVINHNKKVHQKYAEYDRHQAETSAERNQAQAAYSSERSAYAHQVSINNELQREVAYQHSALRQRDDALRSRNHALRSRDYALRSRENAIHQRDKQIASLTRSLVAAKYGRERRTAFVQRAAPVVMPAPGPAPVRASAIRPSGPPRRADVASTLSYGWGSY